MGTAPSQDREFRFERRHFQVIAGLLHELAGISLAQGKAEMVYARLSRRLRELRLPDFDAYVRRLEGPEGEEERGRLVNLLTTNLTKFFREPAHLDHLSKTVLPALAEAQAGSPKPRLRLWSAGCSTGEEPYSIAMVVRDSLRDLSRWDAAILATDIDTDVLAKARRGVYPADAVPAAMRARHTVPGPEPDTLSMAEPLRQIITFKPLNLQDSWPMRGPFDAIFCRNVMIYFDREGRAGVVHRFADLLPLGGLLYVGHSESLHGVSDRFEAAGTTLYRRVR